MGQMENYHNGADKCQLSPKPYLKSWVKLNETSLLKSKYQIYKSKSTQNQTKGYDRTSSECCESAKVKHNFQFP